MELYPAIIISVIHCSISHTITSLVIILATLEFIKLISVTKRLITAWHNRNKSKERFKVLATKTEGKSEKMEPNI